MTMNEALGSLTPSEFRAYYEAVNPHERDAWFDAKLGISEVHDDSAELPRACVPYIPAPVDALARFSDVLRLGPNDLVVDVGAGPGRAALFLRLVSGARVIAFEIQPHLVEVGEELVTRHRLEGVSFEAGDASEELAKLERPTSFFFYCPFGRDRFEKALDHIEAFAAEAPVGVGILDMPRIARKNFLPIPTEFSDLALYRVGGRRNGLPASR